MVVRINSDGQLLQEEKMYLNSSKEDAKPMSEDVDGPGIALTIAGTISSKLNHLLWFIIKCIFILDPSGRSLDLPEDQRKALFISMLLHEKGRAALKRRNSDLALVLLLDSEFKKVRSQLLKGIDNYGN